MIFFAKPVISMRIQIDDNSSWNFLSNGIILNFHIFSFIVMKKVPIIGNWVKNTYTVFHSQFSLCTVRGEGVKKKLSESISYDRCEMLRLVRTYYLVIGWIEAQLTKDTWSILYFGVLKAWKFTARSLRFFFESE